MLTGKTTSGARESGRCLFRFSEILPIGQGRMVGADDARMSCDPHEARRGLVGNFGGVGTRLDRCRVAETQRSDLEKPASSRESSPGWFVHSATRSTDNVDE